MAATSSSQQHRDHVSKGKPSAHPAGAVSSSHGWMREAHLPSWNSCFRCVFNNCGTYRGPSKATDVSNVPRRLRLHADLAAGIPHLLSSFPQHATL